MERHYTRTEFLQAGLGLLVIATGCGDSGSGGSGGSSTGGGGSSAGGNGNTGGSTSDGGSPSTGGSPAAGGGGSTAANPSGGGGAGPGECAAALVALISGNHGHELTVPLADLDSAVDITYDISGTAMHCHEVTLTAADFATLKGGGSVTLKTCNGNDHQLTLSCGTPPTPVAPDCSNEPNFGACG